MSGQINNLVWIPYAYYNKASAGELKAQLTFVPSSFDGRAVEPIQLFFRDDERKLIGLPIDFGLREMSRLGIYDEATITLSEGTTHWNAPRLPVARTPKQQQFMVDLLQALQDRYTVLATAATGSGKTVCALWAGAHLMVPMLVIVDSKELADQWADRIVEHLGIPLEMIGRVEGPVCRYRGCPITVAIVHNLTQKQFEPEFYSAFGMVVWDEAHILGAESFSKSMPLFSARYRLALTATPKRRDGCFGMIVSYFGYPCVESTMPAVPCTVCVIPYTGKVYNGNMPKARLLNCLVKEQPRNALLCRIIVRAYEDGYHFLVVSDRIEHLEDLRDACASVIPRDTMGLFTRQKTVDGKRVQQTSADLRPVRENSRVIFATYNMIEKGVDIPRLSGGLDATPRSSATQLIGRIRREFPGKMHPVWFTIKDERNPRLVSSFYARSRDYKADSNINMTYGKT